MLSSVFVLRRSVSFPPKQTRPVNRRIFRKSRHLTVAWRWHSIFTEEQAVPDRLTMAARRRLTFLKQRIRRALLVGLALVAYLAGAVGVPLPAYVHKPSVQSFPCQSHACGCMTAEQCWKGCCCFSPEEKLVWAQAHQVEPPAEAQAAASQGWNEPRKRDREKQPAQETKASCCSGHCADHSPAPATPSNKPAEPTRTSKWVLGMWAQQCRGGTTSWLLGEPVSAPPPLVHWSYDASPVCWLRPSYQSPSSAALVPPTPPPRG
jgi:hypothetical protein